MLKFLNVFIFFKDNNVERGVEWIFSHADELDIPMETEEQQTPGQEYRDGSGSKSCHCPVLFLDITFP